jgi:signal transduction histidine kinase
VAPNLTDAVLDGQPGALARLDRVVRERVLVDPVVRVKIWSPTGQVIYSDESRIVGQTFALDEDDVQSLRNGTTDAAVGDLSNPENRFDIGLGKVLEVYMPLETPSGRPVLYESYQTFDETAADSSEVWRAFAPPLIGAVLLLWLAQAPLAWAMARRLQSGQRERERLLRGTIESASRERQRIASDLHDGVVQHLAGTTMTLEAAEGTLGKLPPAEIRTALRDAAAGLRAAMRQLRDLIIEINPPNLKVDGLPAALSDLVAPLAGHGIVARLEVPESVELGAHSEELLYRGAQEALRNVVAHSGAQTVTVRVERDGPTARLSVDDDGRGVSDEDRSRAEADGHVGLQLLAGLAADAGGSLAVHPGPEGGTRFVLEIPAG